MEERTQSTKPPTSTTGLLGPYFPLEVRFRIYEAVMKLPHALIISDQPQYLRKNQSVLAPLSQTNRQIHEEVKTWYFQIPKQKRINEGLYLCVTLPRFGIFNLRTTTFAVPFNDGYPDHRSRPLAKMYAPPHGTYFVMALMVGHRRITLKKGLNDAKRAQHSFPWSHHLRVLGLEGDFIGFTGSTGVLPIGSKSMVQGFSQQELWMVAREHACGEMITHH
jgi:hypothetical protein